MDALGVVYGSGPVRLDAQGVGVGRAVLGHEHGRHGVIVVQAQQQVRQALRKHLPPHLGKAGPGRFLARRRDVTARVVVDSQEIERLPDNLQVAGMNFRHVCAIPLPDVCRVLAQQQRLQKPAVELAVSAPGRRAVFGILGGRVGRTEVQHDAQLRPRHDASHGLYSLSVAQQQVVGSAQGGAAVLQAGGVLPQLIAQDAAAPGFVQRRVADHPFAQPRGHGAGVLGKAVRGVAVVPAAHVLKGLRQVPVVERGVGLQAALQHAVNQPLVEVQAHRVDGPAPVWLDARPGQREAVGVHAQRTDQVEVLRPAVVVVTGHLT